MLCAFDMDHASPRTIRIPDKAGTTEGDFEVKWKVVEQLVFVGYRTYYAQRVVRVGFASWSPHFFANVHDSLKSRSLLHIPALNWQGDYFYGQNLAIATTNNKYLDGLGALSEA